MNEQELREALKNLGEAIRDLMKITETEVDDRIVDMIINGVENDLIWSLIYTYLLRFLAREELPMSTTEIMSDLTTAADAGIDPGTLIAIVQAIVMIIKLFRK